MSDELQTFTFVDIGSAVSKSLLFNLREGCVNVLAWMECPTLKGDGWIKENLLNPLGEGVSGNDLLVSVSPVIDENEIRKLSGGQVLDQGDLWGRLGDALPSTDGRTLILDVGSAKSLRVIIEDGELKEMGRIDLGLGQGAPSLIRQLSAEQHLSRWISQQVSFEEVGDYIGNKEIYPAQIPVGKFALEVERAMAREVLRQLITGMEESERNFSQVILGGQVFSKSARLGQSLLVCIDGLEPEGVSEVYTDIYGLLPFFSYHERDCFSSLQKLGSVISFTHSLDNGCPLGRVFVDLGLKEELEVIVRSGDLIRIPLKRGESCFLRLELAAGVGVKDFNPSEKVYGGGLGLILDARGRPLPLLEGSPEDREWLRQWEESLL